MPPFLFSPTSGWKKQIPGHLIPRGTSFADIAQLGERQTEDLKVLGSIPSVCTYLILPLWLSWQSIRLVSERSRVRTSLEAIRVGVVGNISACHADAPGSIPGHGAFFFVGGVPWLTWEKNGGQCAGRESNPSLVRGRDLFYH